MLGLSEDTNKHQIKKATLVSLCKFVSLILMYTPMAHEKTNTHAEKTPQKTCKAYIQRICYWTSSWVFWVWGFGFSFFPRFNPSSIFLFNKWSSLEFLNTYEFGPDSCSQLCPLILYLVRNQIKHIFWDSNLCHEISLLRQYQVTWFQEMQWHNKCRQITSMVSIKHWTWMPYTVIAQKQLLSLRSNTIITPTFCWQRTLADPDFLDSI